MEETPGNAASVLQEARSWDRGTRQTSTLQALSLSRSHLQTSETKVPQGGPIPAVQSTGCPDPPTTGNFFRPLLTWSLTPELCVYTFKRTESHIIIYVTKARLWATLMKTNESAKHCSLCSGSQGPRCMLGGCSEGDGPAVAAALALPDGDV